MRPSPASIPRGRGAAQHFVWTGARSVFINLIVGIELLEIAAPVEFDR